MHCGSGIGIGEEEEEDDFLGEITIDQSVLDNPKAKCVLNKLFHEGNTIEDTIVKFADESVVMDLVIELADDLGGTTNGALDSSNPSTFRLQLNENRIANRTPIEIAGTYLHEAIHAEMRRYLYGATDTSTLPGFPGDFTTDWRYYILSKFGEINIENLSDAEHNAMAENYVDIIANGLSEFDNNALSYGHYEALAWNGLVGFEAWENLPQSKKNELGIKYPQALEGRDLNCN